MKKRIFLVLLLVLGLYFPSSILAETIFLKSGKTVEGKLIEKTDKYIKIDFQGTPLTYFFDEIESIDGQKQPLVLEKKEPIPEPNVNQISENSVQSDITQETKNKKTIGKETTSLWDYGLIDKTGKMVIELQINGYTDFSEGLAAVKIGKKWGFIDKTGKMVIEPRFYDARPFSEGLAEVSITDNQQFESNNALIGNKWGYIDTTGKMVIEPKLDLTHRFSGGLASVLIDRNGVLSTKQGKWFLGRNLRVPLLFLKAWQQRLSERNGALSTKQGKWLERYSLIM